MREQAVNADRFSRSDVPLRVSLRISQSTKGFCLMSKVSDKTRQSL